MKKGALSRCLVIEDDGIKDKEDCDSKCSWIQARSDGTESEKLAEKYGLMPPIVHSYGKRPVFREWDEGRIYARINPVFIEQGHMRTAQLSIFMKNDLIITAADSEHVETLFTNAEKEFQGNSALRKKGCEGLFIWIIREIVNETYSQLESLGVKIDRAEVEITNNPEKNALPKLHTMRKDILVIRHLIWSLRSFSDALNRSQYLAKSTKKEGAEMHEETLHLMEISESYREMLSSLTDIYVSSLSYRTNEIMKVLTIIATIFIPLTFITGLYGMNFRPSAGPYSMPELNWYWGYPVVLILMLFIGIAMLMYFRKKGWM